MDNEEYDIIAEAHQILSAHSLADAFRPTIEKLFVKAVTQIYGSLGRKITREEAEGIYDEVVHCVTVAALWSAWERGEIGMVGFDGEEILWGPA